MSNRLRRDCHEGFIGSPAGSCVRDTSANRNRIRDTPVSQYRPFKNYTQEQHASGQYRKARRSKEEVAEARSKPKKPGSSYNIFYAQMFPRLARQYPGQGVPVIAKAAGDMWNNLSDSQKRPYQMEFERRRAAYERQLQGMGLESARMKKAAAQPMMVQNPLYQTPPKKSAMKKKTMTPLPQDFDEDEDDYKSQPIKYDFAPQLMAPKAYKTQSMMPVPSNFRPSGYNTRSSASRQLNFQ